MCNGEPWFDFWALGWLFWALGGIWWASPWARRTLVKFPDSSGSVGGSENQKVVRDTWNCAQCCQKGVAHSTQKLWPKIDFLSIRLLNSPFIGRGAEQLAKQILHWFVCSYCQQYTIWQHCAQFQVSLTTFLIFWTPPSGSGNLNRGTWSWTTSHISLVGVICPQSEASTNPDFSRFHFYDIDFHSNPKMWGIVKFWLSMKR